MENISVKVIGCGDAFGSGGQMNTCFYVKSSSVKMLIDCGASSLPLLRKYDIPITELDMIVLSHFHGDHFGGLPFLLLYLATYGQEKPLKIISPGNCREKIKELLDIQYPGSQVLEKLNIEFISYQAYHTVTTTDLTITAFPAIHTEESIPHSIRIDIQGKIISYSGDTEWTEDIIGLADNADLFICECCFYKKQVKGHLNYFTLQENLNRLNYKRILLTHFDTEMLNNRGHVQLDYAKEGEEVEV